MIPVEEASNTTEGTPVARAPLSCRVFNDFSGLDHLQTLWDDAVLRADGSVYMTYDWVRVWWEFYGQRAQLRLFVFCAGDRIVAAVPIYWDSLGWGPLRTRVARLVGSNIPPKVFNPPIPDTYAADVLAEILLQLFVRDQCDVLSLGPVSASLPRKASLQAACTQHADLVGRWTVTKGVHSVFDLPRDMEAYYGALSKNERKNRRKYDLRLLKKEYDTRVDVVCDPASTSEEFEHFAEQHKQQWFVERKSGHFGAWPRALEFNRALVDAQAKLGRLRFIRILTDGKVVANQYTFAFGNRYYWELPARSIEPKWDRFSLGPTAVVTMLAQGIVEGMKQVEGGLGHYDYKLRLGAKEYNTLTFRIVAPGLPSRLRFLLLSFVHNCVNVVYHKVLYRRIMPRLPALFWRPQWRWWLRLDF